MDEFEKFWEALKPHAEKLFKAYGESQKQEGKREVMAALTAAAGVEQPVKRRRRRKAA